MDILDYNTISLPEFAARLASSSPVPGGGGAAAYSGCLGVSLIAMVANLTLGKKKYADVEQEVQQILARADELRTTLFEGVPKDSAAFLHVSVAYKMPEGTPEEQAAKSAELSLRSKAAADLPMELARCCHEGLQLAVRMAEIGSLLAVSDVVCGAGLLLAALKGLLMMVSVNLPLVDNEQYVQAMQQEYSRLLVTGTELEARVNAVVDARAAQVL